MSGAYTVAQLADMPFHEVLEIWESVQFNGVLTWIAHQPEIYEKQERK